MIQQHRNNTETSHSIARRHEHPKTGEAEENDTKNNFMKMMMAFTEERKFSLKEKKEKTNKKLEENNKIS